MHRESSGLTEGCARRERYGRELNYSRLGFPSISACACALPALAASRAPDGDWLLRDARAPPPPAPRARRAAPRAAAAPAAPAADPEDALPGIDYVSGRPRCFSACSFGTIFF